MPKIKVTFDLLLTGQTRSFTKTWELIKSPFWYEEISGMPEGARRFLPTYPHTRDCYRSLKINDNIHLDFDSKQTTTGHEIVIEAWRLTFFNPTNTDAKFENEEIAEILLQNGWVSAAAFSS